VSRRRRCRASGEFVSEDASARLAAATPRPAQRPHGPASSTAAPAGSGTTAGGVRLASHTRPSAELGPLVRNVNWLFLFKSPSASVLTCAVKIMSPTATTLSATGSPPT
jgi:hypothetical protein